jgi:rubrerythrin
MQIGGFNMYIDSGNMIMMPKSAQNLEIVKTPEKFTDRELLRAIRDAIIAEEGAIKQYESAADATDNEKVKEVLNDISNEEKVHVFELQTLLNQLSPEEKEFQEKGEKEVENKKD